MIAIGIACNPKVIIADEPTTALDVTIQAQILELMRDLTRRLNIGLVLITHNLGIVARYADRVNVMYAGQIVESGTAEDILLHTRHPYTLGLLRAVPRLNSPSGNQLDAIEGLPPNLLNPPTGCRFAERCKFRIDVCQEEPPLCEVAPGHESRCFRTDVESGNATFAIGKQAIEHSSAKLAPTVLKLENVNKAFGDVRAVSGVSLEIAAGETLGLVGESGCGKSTLGRLILALEPSSSGSIRFNDVDIGRMSKRGLQTFRRNMQVVFQDPFLSLNPRMTIGEILQEPLRVHRLVPDKASASRRVADLLSQVGLYPYMADRFPHELSGGQRQRVGIARALALDPQFIVCDEAVSALDVSVQAQIVNLLVKLQKQLGLTFLFIAHDLAVVRHISTRVAVMYRGRIIELADCNELFENPLHPYTRALLAAAPNPDPLVAGQRQAASLRNEITTRQVLSGCVFASRCPIAVESCHTDSQTIREASPRHLVACFRANLVAPC
ncbi:MAG: ABC transporter ATP-binding protein [Pseudolabrys sp.]